MTEKRKSLPWPFYYAKHWYGVELQGPDLDYINNVITSDKMYRLIRQAHEINTGFMRTTNPEEYDDPDVISIETGVWRDFVEVGNAIHFFEKFLDDEICPPRVKYFLYKWIGNQRGYIKLNDMHDDYILRSCFTESWFRTVCIRRQKKKWPQIRRKNKKKHIPKIRGVVPGTSQPKLHQTMDNIPTIYMFLEKTKKR